MSTPASAPVFTPRRVYPGLTNSVLMLVGDTGSGKTTLLATLAEWVWLHYRKITLYYGYDGGGWGDQLQALIDRGVVWACQPRGIDPAGDLGLALGAASLCSKGYWPVERNPQTGEVAPGTGLVPLQRVELIEGRRVIVREPWAEPVGAIFHDSLSSLAQWAKDDVNARAAKDILGGEKGAIRTQSSLGIDFGSAGRGGIGFVQDRGSEWLSSARMIHGLVAPPVFTALEDKGSDDGGIPLYGPKLVGKAKTAEIPSWVGACLNAVAYPLPAGVEHRLYTRPYTMPGDPVPHRAKVRVIPDSLPTFFVDGPGEARLSGFSLAVYMEACIKATEEADRRTEERVGAGPGLPSARVEHTVAPRVSEPAQMAVRSGLVVAAGHQGAASTPAPTRVLVAATGPAVAVAATTASFLAAPVPLDPFARIPSSAFTPAAAAGPAPTRVVVGAPVMLKPAAAGPGPAPAPAPAPAAPVIVSPAAAPRVVVPPPGRPAPARISTPPVIPPVK